MSQNERNESTIWHSEKWRITVADRTNTPGKKAVAYFKDIRVASYDERGLRDHQDGSAVMRIPIHGDIQAMLKGAWEIASFANATRPKVLV